MSRSLIRQANAEATIKFVQESSSAIDTLVTDDKVAAEIYEWLASLKLLHGVPFHYIVPDQDMLPQESIRFFNLDINWVNSLVDGAYSIGRNEVSDEGIGNPTNTVDLAFYDKVHELANKKARSKRSDHFGKETETTGETLEVVTGFLLRSEVVSGWKGLQVNAFDSTHYPGNGVNNQVQTLPVLRLEHLSEEVLFGIFEGDVYRLDIHEPSEGLHFGFDPDGANNLMKKLRKPTDGTALDPSDALTNADLNEAQIFRKYAPAGDPIEPGSGGEVVNMYKLSALMYKQLRKAISLPNYKEPLPNIENGDSTKVPVLPGSPEDANPLVSSDFAMQMVEGAGMVSFIKNINP